MNMVLTILGFGENLREELLLLTLFFCSSICVLYFVCEFFVLFSRRREAKIQQTRSTIQSLIVESVFDEERLEENITALKELNTHAGVKSMSKRRRYFLRQLMMDEMLLIKKNISGTGLTTLYELYKGMRLYDDSFRKINSRYYHYIVLGLRELSEMNYADCQPVITSLVNHKNRDVRIEAQLAMVRLWGSEGLKFLSTIEYDISEWQQMTMLQLLHTETQRPAGIQEWLSSPHESVIVFALRLLEKYNCFDLIDDLYGLFNHRSEKVRIQAIQCFRNIFDHRSETELLGIYASGNKNVKLNILEVLKPLATEVSLPFLLQEIKNEDVDICFVAVGVLCRLRSTDEIVSAFESAFEKDSPFFSVLILMLDHYLYAEFQYR